jgi:phosphatidylserine/phosphatidylglycerophosphate/cardiolipin synthase-like enzyme
MGYKALDESGSTEKVGILFDNRTFLSAFERDINVAKHEIVISSPVLHKNRVQQMIKLLSAAQINGVKIMLVTQIAENYKPTDLSTAVSLMETIDRLGIKVIKMPNASQRFATIDQSIVWYGSINLLAYGKSYENIIRFENAEIAGELIDTIAMSQQKV